MFFCLCTREDLLFFCGKKKFSGQTCYLCFHELESVWIWVLIRQTVKRVVKLHVFVLTELFFCFCSLENSLWPQLLRWTLYLHLCLTSALQQIFIHLALLQPPQCFLHSSSHPLLLVSYWPFVLPLSSSSSSSPIYLFFSSPSLSLSSVSHILLDSALGLMLMTHHPTWKHFLCGCEGAFTAVNENFKHRRPRPAPPEKKKCGWWGGKSRKSAFSPLIQILPRLMKVL